jgi:hypothetical protein
MAIKFLNTATGITEAAGDNSTKIATTAYVDAAASAIPIGNYLPLSAGSSKPLTAALYIPHYIYHVGDAGTFMGFPANDRLIIGTNGVTRVDITNSGFCLGDNTTNISVSTILDEDNMGSNSATALVTQQSVKAYVDAHTSGIGGSGTTNSIPMFTPNGTTLGNSAMSQANVGTGNAKRITVSGARMTITSNGGDADGGTLNLTANSARLGIATNAYPGAITEPEASLDVGKNARIRGSLNVGATNEQYLFVSTTGDTPVGYVKMGYYGQGTDYDTTNTPTATPQYTSAFGSGGRVVEDIRYYTFRLSRSQMAALNSTPKTLIPAESGYNFFIEDAYLFQNNNGGFAPVYNNGNITLDYVYSQGSTVTAASVDATITNSSRGYRKIIGLQRQPYIYGNSSALSTMGVQLNAPSASNNGSGNVTYFLRLKVKKVNILNDISSNSQIIVVS